MIEWYLTILSRNAENDLEPAFWRAGNELRENFQPLYIIKKKRLFTFTITSKLWYDGFICNTMYS